MNLTPPERRPFTVLHPSEKILRFCPYCEERGFGADKLDIWYSRSVETGIATRWTRCQICFAMWREVYNWNRHHFEHVEHWKPRA